MTYEHHPLISAVLLRLRMRAPFFATLALFAQIGPSHAVETAATDGRSVWVNPEYLQTLPPPHQEQLLLHNVLHAALLHVSRRGERDPRLWNIACDIVVNGISAQIEGLPLGHSALRDRRLEQLSVEEVYELLQKNPNAGELELPDADLLDEPSDDGRGEGGSEDYETPATGRNEALERHWRNAHQHANIIAFGVAQGRLHAGLQRELAMLSPARLDWRAHLWRYLVQTPTDFQGYDRRLISRGLYLDVLEGEALRVYVAVDTSGSVDAQQLRLMVSEIQGILRAYPHVACDLYYADSRAYGPYPLTDDEPPPAPVGDGGTDFRAFFATVERDRRPFEHAVCIYLTDGFGDFPEQAPELPVLWVVTAGGRGLEAFPFGETVRMV